MTPPQSMPVKETVQILIAKLRGISANIEVAMQEIDGVVAVLEQNSRVGWKGNYRGGKVKL